MSSSRREFVTRTMPAGAALATLLAAGCAEKAPPPQSPAAPRALMPDEIQVLEALGDVLVPGSAKAGLASYVKQQLSAPAAQSMLLIKYLRVDPPFAAFYREGLRAVEKLARARHGKSFAQLEQSAAEKLVSELAGGQPSEWDGPPAGLFCFAVRADAVDVVYGTLAGFAKLGIPYMAHITPLDRWDE